MDSWRRRDFTSRNLNAGVYTDPRLPPPLIHREFCRYDYSHNDTIPRLVPLVREYDHGIGNARDIPVINQFVPPPPIVLNSVAHNPVLLDNFRRQAVFNPSFDNSNLPVFMEPVLPGVPDPSLGSLNFNNNYIPPQMVSNDAMALQQLRAELAQTRAKIRLLKLGAAGGEVGELPPHNELPDDVQDVVYQSADEGNP